MHVKLKNNKYGILINRIIIASRSWWRQCTEKYPDKKILVVDADVEAPGLTWMAEAGYRKISYLDILSIMKMKNKEYSDKFLEEFIIKSQEHLYIDGIVSCPYTEKNVIKDILILVPKNELIYTI